MTTNTIAPCALGVTGRTLSDFRSDGLSAKEMERLQAHVEQCSACQFRLDELEEMARILRSQPEPNGHAQLWQNVRANIAASTVQPTSHQSRRTRGKMSVSSQRSARFWAAFGSIAAVVALSVGFVALFAGRGGWPPATRTTTSTPVTIHSGSLTWRRVIVPKGFPSVIQYGEADSSTYTAALISPSDGKTAYACQADRKYVTSPVVWATHDAGESWSVITPTPLSEKGNIGGCRIVLDANDANTLIVSFFLIRSPYLPGTRPTYATFDGGATWTQPAGVNDSSASAIISLAGARGKIYASRAIYTPDGKSHEALFVSGDRMQSWTQIDANLPEAQPNPSNIHDTGKTSQLWVNASTGEVLDLTYAGSLWSTVDDGAHWQKLDFPDGVSSRASMLLAGAPTTTTYLTICGVFSPMQSPNDQWLECTTDNGKVWRKRPLLPTLHLYGMVADGSIYATAWVPPNQGSGDASLYRLPPSATSTAGWQRLGTIPGSQHSFGFQASPSGTNTIFWVFPAISTTSDSSGTKTYTQPYYYVATYP